MIPQKQLAIACVATLIFLSVTMASVSLTSTVSAADSGNFTYELIGDGTEAEITGYHGPGGELEIPGDIDGKKVTRIGSNAFYGSSSLTSVIVSSNVTAIGDGAFGACSSLTTITLPDSVTAIGEGAFSDCYALTSVVIPGGVTVLNNYAFAGCIALTTVDIPNGVTYIGEHAFYFCSSLVSITIPGAVTTVGNGAFGGCSALTEINVDENNENYASVDGVLYSKDKKTLIQCPAGKNGEFTVPGGVTAIGDGAFAGCIALTSVTMPSSVTDIGESAFSNCIALTSMIIGDGVTAIGGSAFSYCSALASVTIPSSVTTIGELTFSDCTALTSIVIPSSVTDVGYGAFQACSALASVTIPGSVATISGNAFAGCSSLTEINVDENNENYASVDGVLYSKDKKTLIQCPAGKNGEFTIPGSVTTIGTSAFSGCSALTSVIMGEGITDIGSNAFAGCVNLTTMVFHGDAPTVGSGWTSGSDKLTAYYHRDATGFATPIWSDTYCYSLSAISGTIKDADGNIVGGAAVTVSGGMTASTDPQGVFTLDGLLPGTYTLTIVKDGYVTIEQEVEVLKGEDQALGTLNMELSADPNPNDEVPTDKGGDDTLLIVGAAVAAIAAIIVAAVLLMRRRSLL